MAPSLRLVYAMMTYALLIVSLAQSECTENADCASNKDCMFNDLAAQTGTCCVKLHRDGCSRDEDCCFDNSRCSQSGFCYVLGDINDAADSPFLLNQNILGDDNDINSGKATHSAIFYYFASLLIFASIVLINAVLYLIHKHNHKIFFISKRQVELLNDDDNDEHGGYLNEQVLFEEDDSNPDEEQQHNVQIDGQEHVVIRANQNQKQDEYEIEDIPSDME
eukprot:CAMPEP_0197042388 /NCGR_PEP_ID=MMETSP1384-20130603/18774_1 /TAXON_ID=29189 /ORGANISM="Ammonia sp." /LENGTH=220 /DNA_ID=CAMNT_0042473481 /DNA_START=7 /DNA_END=669 /DNA_ORIENTATION=-